MLDHSEIMRSHEFHLSNNIITREVSESVIDHAWRSLNLSSVNATIRCRDISDHNAILAFPNVNSETGTTCEGIVSEEVDFQNAQEIVNGIFTINRDYDNYSSNEMANFLNDTIKMALQCSTNRKIFKRKGNAIQPWLSNVAKKMMERKKKNC